MARPSKLHEQRDRLLPIVCEVFAEYGYYGTTTAELARRCEVRENILYRLWDDKKAMFIAAIDDIFERRMTWWEQVLAERPAEERSLDSLIAFEAQHHGEYGFYRIVFTALVQNDEPEIRAALIRMYKGFHRRLNKLITESRGDVEAPALLPPEETTWVLMGLATIAQIIRDLDLLPNRRREDLLADAARYLLTGEP